MDWTVRPPHEVASWILTRLFAGDTTEAPDRAFPLAPFQEAAVARARRILDRRRGVLVADGVGLGKTFVALALIEEALTAGSDVLVAVPAALRSVWRAPLRRLAARSPRGAVHVVSHAQLSRGSYPAGLAQRIGLVVVDEAHRFRNPRTRRYAALADLCAHARVVLLTATPVNNGLGDLHSLLRLFALDDGFIDVGVPSLRGLLDPGPHAAELGRILGEVVVRRTRAMVSDGDQPVVASGAPARFPRRAPLAVIRYDDPRIAMLAGVIGRLELAPYRLATGAGNDAGSATALIRLGLLKRLESGLAPLSRSVQRQLGFFRSFLDALDQRRLLRPHRPVHRTGSEDRDPLQLILLDLVTEPWPPGLDPVATRAAVLRDVRRLTGIRAALAGPDPKLAALAGAIAHLGPDKVVVFTEFRDTAAAIWRALTAVAPVGRIDGAGAWLGTRPAGRGAVVERFAPRSNHVAEPPLRERVDVLVTTDVLAEGVNLQDARHVINYDLPWNPVRLMQRIGRVDRLGSPHDVIVPHLFLPADGLDSMLGLTRRLRAKLGAIADTVGGQDAIELMDRLGAGDQDGVSRVMERIEEEGLDPLERLRLRWYRRDQRLPCSDQDVPAGSVLVGAVRAGHAGGDALPAAVVLVRTGDRLRLVEVGVGVGVGVGDGVEVEVEAEGVAGKAGDGGAGAARFLQAALDTGPGHRARPSLRHAARAVGAALGYLRDIAGAAAAPSAVRATDPSARIARTIRRALATPGAWARPTTIARADRLLQRLSVPLPGHTNGDAAGLADALDVSDTPERVLDRVEAWFDRWSNPASGSGVRRPPVTARSQNVPGEVLAVLLAASGTPSRRGPARG
jgi:hypothetical protein